MTAAAWEDAPRAEQALGALALVAFVAWAVARYGYDADWAWIPQLVFVILLGGLSVHWIRQKRG